MPDSVELREGARNVIELRNVNVIGGGSEGAEQNVGILAPGCAIEIQAPGSSITGFSYLNSIDSAVEADFIGQMVVLNSVREMIECTITFDEGIANNLPDSIRLEGARGDTDLLAVFEDFQ